MKCVKSLHSHLQRWVSNKSLWITRRSKSWMNLSPLSSINLPAIPSRTSDPRSPPMPSTRWSMQTSTSRRRHQCTRDVRISRHLWAWQVLYPWTNTFSSRCFKLRAIQRHQDKERSATQCISIPSLISWRSKTSYLKARLRCSVTCRTKASSTVVREANLRSLSSLLYR